MKYITLTFKNIKKFIRYHPILFSFLFIVQIVCCVAVFISCGMAYNMNYVEEIRQYPQEFYFSFENEEDLPVLVIIKDNDTIDKYYQVADPVTGEETKVTTIEFPNAMDMAQARPLLDELFEKVSKFKPVLGRVHFYENKKIIVNINDEELYSIYPYPESMDYVEETPYIIDSDKHIFVAPVFINGKKNQQYPYDIGETYTFGSEDFKCVGNNSVCLYIPYKVIPDSCAVDGFSLTFDNNLYKEDIQEINSIVEDIFGTKINDSSLPDPINPFELQLSQMLVVISIVVMVIVVLTIAKFYNFVLARRRKTLAILRLCGCTRERVHAIYMLEIFITMALSTAVGFAVFRLVLFDYIAGMYHSFDKFFSPEVIVMIIAAYFLISMLILTVTIQPSTRVSIKEMEKKRR
ncbi:MAG: ABC transporter permease [Clostridia bacterium]|nr:ABC transporter permease [Clostridia bacterium]